MVCPNLTIRDRLRVLRPSDPGSRLGDETPEAFVRTHVHRMISGEEETRRGAGLPGFPELWNGDGEEVTLRIDSKLLEAAERGDAAVIRKDAAEALRAPEERRARRAGDQGPGSTKRPTRSTRRRGAG